MHAMGTRLSNGDKTPKMTLDCMWEFEPHNSSSGQALQHHTYQPEIEVLSQTSSWWCRVNALPWRGDQVLVHILAGGNQEV